MKKLSSSPSPVKQESAPMSKTEPALPSAEDLDTRLSLIQALIPIGLAAVSEALQGEVEALCGSRYTRKEEETPNRRWGSQTGSVYLADQKAPVRVPRVRNVLTNEEVTLSAYQKLGVVS